jgi:hypothetical protein
MLSALPLVFWFSVRDGLPLHVGGVVGSAAFQSDDVVNDVAGVGNDVSASPEGLGAPHFVFRISS